MRNESSLRPREHGKSMETRVELPRDGRVAYALCARITLHTGTGWSGGVVASTTSPRYCTLIRTRYRHTSPSLIFTDTVTLHSQLWLPFCSFILFYPCSSDLSTHTRHFIPDISHHTRPHTIHREHTDRPQCTQSTAQDPRTAGTKLEARTDATRQGVRGRRNSYMS